LVSNRVSAFCFKAVHDLPLAVHDLPLAVHDLPEAVHDLPEAVRFRVRSGKILEKYA
jgi:hypothetical protein